MKANTPRIIAYIMTALKVFAILANTNTLNAQIAKAIAESTSSLVFIVRATVIKDAAMAYAEQRRKRSRGWISALFCFLTVWFFMYPLFACAFE